MTMDELKKDMEAAYVAAKEHYDWRQMIELAGPLATIFQTEELIRLYAQFRYQGEHFTRKRVPFGSPLERTEQAPGEGAAE